MLINDFEWRQTAYGRALVCGALEPYAPHLFTTREWPLGTATEKERGGAWGSVALALGAPASRLARAHQVHGAAVVIRRVGDPPIPANTLPQADILMSDDPSIVLAVQTADCVPLLMVDRRTGAVAVAHAGWRGLAARVPAVTIEAMAQTFATRAEDVIVAAGPSICADRYEVDGTVRRGFEAGGFSVGQLERWFLPGRQGDRWQFDGWASARDQLQAAGIPALQIYVAELCTAGDPALLCSYRRDGAAAGRIAAAIRSSPRRP
jgi:YfiH family protein